MYQNSLNVAQVIYSTPNKEGFTVDSLPYHSRTQLYIPKDIFKIDNTNNQFRVMVSPGADYMVYLSNGEYEGAALATEIQTKMGNGFSVEYNTTTKKFRVTNTANSFVLYADSDVNFWQTIGFTSNSVVGDSANNWVYADVSRRNTGIYIQYDLGGSAPAGFFALLGERNKTFSLSATAIINIRLSNINDFASAPININIEPSINGAFAFLDGIIPGDPFPHYRYFWLSVFDDDNLSEYIAFSQIFLGGFNYFENRTIDNGFSLVYNDRSVKTESVSGALFFEKYAKYPYLSSLKLSYLNKQQMLLLQQMWFDLGISQHFYISLDSGNLNQNVSDLCFFGVFDSDPNIEHIAPVYYNASFTFRGD
jgi:hypothetical protein